MAYNRTNWQDNKTPINAQNLNNIEQGIVDNETAAKNNATAIQNNATAIEGKQDKLKAGENISIGTDGTISATTNVNNSESYVDIKNQITKTGVISDLEVYSAYAKKRNGFISLKMILRTKTGWPTSNIENVIAIPEEYKASAPVVSFCRMNSSYDYPSWNAVENMGFLSMSSNYMNIRTSVSGMKVAVIDLVY